MDREERPDIDLIYQAASNIMGYQGGWPLNIFLKPDGGTLFRLRLPPKEERQGQPAFRRILTETRHPADRPGRTGRSTTAAILAQLGTVFERDMRAPVENIVLDMSAIRVAQRFDIFFGGLQQAQKIS